MNDYRQLMREVALRCPTGRLPDDYLVVDIETNGFNWNPKPGEKPAVVTQLGYAAVRGQKEVANSAHYVKRPPGTLKGTKASEITGITDEMLAKMGENPGELFSRFYDLLKLYRGSHAMFVGHNISKFDAPFLDAEFERHGIPFRFEDNSFVDTGCLYKAVQLRTFPNTSEDLHHFFMRVANTRSRVKWKLTLAVETLGIDRRFGLDLEAAHDAGFDCHITHLLFEELRRLSDSPVDPNGKMT